MTVVAEWLVALVVFAALRPETAAPLSWAPQVSLMMLVLYLGVPLFLLVRCCTGHLRVEAPGLLAAFAFLALGGLSYAVNGRPASGWPEFLSMAEGAALFALVAVGMGSRPSWRAVWWGLVLAGLATAADVIPTGLEAMLRSGAIGRSNALNFPNAVGGMLAWIAMLPAARALAPGPAVKRLLYAAVAAVLLLGMGLTLSRGAMLGTGVGLLVLVGMGRRFSSRGLRALLAVAAIALLAAAAVTSLRPELIARDVRSVPLRLGAWQSALGMVRNAPWLGVGPGNFTYDYAAFQPGFQAYAYMSAHNLYLEIAAQYGLLGLAAFLGVPLSTVGRMLRGRGSAVSADPAGALAALATFAVHVFFHEDLLWFAPTLLGFWAMFGYAAALATDPKTGDSLQNKISQSTL